MLTRERNKVKSETSTCQWQGLVSLLQVAILTNTDVSGNPADVDVGDVLLLDDVLQARFRELLVVKERRVGVDIGVGSLIIIFDEQTCLSLRGNA